MPVYQIAFEVFKIVFGISVVVGGVILVYKGFIEPLQKEEGGCFYDDDYTTKSRMDALVGICVGLMLTLLGVSFLFLTLEKLFGTAIYF